MRAGSRLAILVLLTVAVVGCGRLPTIPLPFRGPPGGTNQVEFDGLRFRPRVAATTSDRRGFAVTVPRASRSVTSALEAGRHTGIGYCLNGFGGSDIAWTAGPDRASGEVALAGGALVLAGTCTTR